MTHQDKLDILEEKKRFILNINTEKQHSKNKLTARERISHLLDPGTFSEIGMLTKPNNKDNKNKDIRCDGVITGHGKINGRQIYISSQDFTQKGGTLGSTHAKKIINILELALKTGCPYISLNDSAGARIEEGVKALEGYGSIFRLNTMASGVIPQISAIMGPCAGGAAYSPALMDFIFMVKDTSNMFITGPDVIKKVTGEDLSIKELGDSIIHSKNGTSHFLTENDKDCLDKIKKLLSYLPQNNLDSSPTSNTEDKPRKTPKLKEIVPANNTKPYNMKEVIEEIFDYNTFFEVQQEFAKNAIVGFTRLDGLTVGVVANQPNIIAGCLNINASSKISRFVRTCDAFHIPIINLVDVPGFLPGKEQEHRGIIKHGAKILHAYAESTVPKLSLVLRKAYGGAYIALCSKSLGIDQTFAWPTAEIAVMGAEQAINILHKDLTTVAKEETIKQYEEKYLNPYNAAEYGIIDDVITPENTRLILIRSLRMLLNKRTKNPAKKHGNIPL